MTRVTIYLDDDLLAEFRLRAEGKSYQTLINEALEQIVTNAKPITEEMVKRIIRKKLHVA